LGAKGGHWAKVGVPSALPQTWGRRVHRDIVNPEGCLARRATRARRDGVVIMPVGHSFEYEVTSLGFEY
jgi:hypothetical protein